MLAKIYRTFETTIINSWWVIFFMLGCYLCYEQGLRQRDRDYSKLYTQFQELEKEKKLASTLQAHLLLQINSQSDPDWIELTLMKGLGLVAEGQTKVIFTKD